MRADSPGARGTGLLLALALLSNACVSLKPPPGPGRSLRYTQIVAERMKLYRDPDELHPLWWEMSDGRAWEGNIKARLYERVRERGYDSLTAFAEARPTASLVALAEELGPDDIAGVQVFSGLLAEAERSNQVTRLVRGQLVRELWAYSPTAGRPCWTTQTASRLPLRSARG